MVGRDKNLEDIPSTIFPKSESDRETVEIPAEEGHKYRILSI